MAQARRIKRKPARKPKKSRPRRNLPWGLMLVVLICGIVLGLLIDGSRDGDTGFGAGLKALWETHRPVQSEDEDIAELIENKSSEKEYEFYELLRDIEKVMPDDLPDAQPERPTDNLDYYLQAASFREYADAEELRAKLALRGFKSVTQMRDVEGKGTFYRVRLGPYPDKRKARTAKNKLQKIGMRPFIYSVEK